MANTTYDFSKHQFTEEQIFSFNDIITKKVLEAPELATMHTFENNIRNDREIGFAEGSLGLVGKAAQGCGTRTPDNKTLGSAVKKWSPVRWEIFLQFCWTDLSSNFGRYLRKIGTDVEDLSDTEFLKFMETITLADIKQMLFRFVWFNDTSAACVDDSPAGVFTSGTDTDYFNLFDGLFAQLSDIVTTTPARKTDLSAYNGQATFALQDSTLTNALAYAAVQKVIDDALPLLRGRSDLVIYSTESVWRKAMRYLQDKSLAFTLDFAINGLPLLKFDGYSYYAVPMWDQIIRAYQSNGTKYNLPHRILMTTRGNLPVGLEGASAFDYLKIWHNDDTEYTNMKVKDAMDAKVLEDNLIQYGI